MLKHRPKITKLARDKVIEEIANKLESRMIEKGDQAFVSSHEVLGIVTEEFDELKDAVHSNVQPAVRRELMDIAVGAIFGIACIDEDTLDW